jgi:hypothetical protein
MRIILFLLFLTCSLPLLAQENGEFRKITARLFCFYGNGESLINPGPNGEKTICGLTKNIIARPVKLTAKNNRILFYSADVKKADNEKFGTANIVASATISPKISSVTLVFIAKPHPEGAKKWNVYPIADSAEHFPPGGVYLANFHQHDIRCIIGEHKVQLKPGQSKVLKRPTQRNKFNMAQVAFQFRLNDKWKTAKETAVRFTATKRHLLISYADQGSGRPRVSTHQIFTYSVPKSKPQP